MRTLLAALALVAVAGCSQSPTAPRDLKIPAAAPHKDTFCTDDPPPGATILGECPYGSGYIVSLG